MRPLALSIVLAALPAAASTAVELDLSALTAASTEVVRARVESSTTAWTGDHRRIVTYVTVAVLETWKGHASGEMVVVQPGGERDGIGQRVSGVTALREGDEVVLFLERSGPRHRVVGLSQGIYRVAADGPKGALRAIPASLEGLDLLTPSGAAPTPRQATMLAELRASVRSLR